MNCPDLLHNVKAIETALRLLRNRLVHAVGRERQDLQLQIADKIDELAIAEGAYEDAGCVTPPPPASVRWVQANPYAIQVKQTSFEDPISGIYHAGNVKDVLVLQTGGAGAVETILVGTQTGGVWLLQQAGSISSQSQTKPLSDTWNDPNVQCLAQGLDHPLHVYAGCGTTLYETDVSKASPLENWRDLSPGLGPINRVVVFASPPRIALATDNGIFWSEVPAAGGNYAWKGAQFPGLPGFFVTGRYTALVAGPASSVVAAAFGDSNRFFGIFRGTWNDLASPGSLVLRAANSIAGLPSSPGNPLSQLTRVALAAPANNPAAMIAISSDRNLNVLGVFSSVDGGQNWTTIQNPIVTNAGSQALSTNAGTLDAGHLPSIAMSSQGAIAFGWLNGMFISTDGGASWRSISTVEMHSDSNQVYFDPRDATSQRLFYCSDGGVVATSDLGQTFDSSFNQFLLNLQFYSTLVVRNFYGTLTGRGELVAGGLQDNQNVFCRAIGEVSPWIHMGGCDGGLVELLDNGVAVSDWVCGGNGSAASAAPLPRQLLHNVNASPPAIPVRNPEQAADPNGLLSPIVQGVRFPAFKNPAGQLMYAVGSPFQTVKLFGLFGNGDGSDLHWEDLLAGTPAQAIPLKAGFVVNSLGSLSGSTIFVATNGGKVFRINTSTGAIVELSVPVRIGDYEPATMNRMVVLSDTLFFALYNRSLTEGYVLRFAWDGTSFQCTTLGKAQGLPGDGYFAISDWMDSTLFVANESQVFMSRDSGASWTDASFGLPKKAHCADLHYVDDVTGQFALYLSTYGRSLWRAGFG